ncbi:tetratricopeptide repeat protein [Ancylomarina sp.]|uniref:tetratricopeptide repeat-containing sensor histidine kinase n=1 Tax=Ancylomarina sp. TaxID=1970196 RepID=UPI00356131C7
MSKTLLVLFFILNSFISGLNAQNQIEKSDLNKQDQIVTNLIESSVSYRGTDKKLSVEICEKAIKLAEKEQADSLLALALKTQGINYYLLSDDDSSKLYYEKAVSKFNEIGNLIQAGKVLGNIGLIYKRRGEYTKALEYYLKEIEIFSEINHTVGLSSIYINMGSLANTMGNTSRAGEYFNSALKLAEKENNIADQISALNNLGAIYESQDKFHEALDAYEKSLKIVLNSGNSKMESTLYLNIGLIHRRAKAYDQAESYLKKSFDIRKLRGNHEELLGVYNEMFEVALAKEEYIKARRLIGSMQDLAEMNGDYEWLGDVYQGYYNFYSAIHNYKLALESYEKFRTIGDSINDALNKERYNELMVKYDVGQTKQEMVLMAQETRIQGLELDKKNAWLVAMLVIMLLGVIAIVVSFRINKLKAEQKFMNLDQKVLLSQMNPHFLFNALTAVQSLVLDNESDKASLYLSDLGTLVRNILEDSRKEKISLSQELITLEKYIDLQKLRFNFPIEFRFDIEENIDLDELSIPPMLTQPFIENALVHANLQQVEKPEVLIKIELLDPNFVAFSIQDNGIGIEEGKKQSLMKENKSLAMQIARDRIQIYNYKSKFQMKLEIIDLKYVDQNKQGTLARFTIPTQA